MKTWTPLHLHSHYSLLDGLNKPEQISKMCANYGYNSCAITDHGNISGSVSFMEEMKSKHIKPIIGCELYVTDDLKNHTEENRKNSHLVVLAKNYNGWRNLIKLVSKSNSSDAFYYKPRVDINMLADHSDDLIAFSGHPGSHMFNVLFDSKYSNTVESIQAALSSDYYGNALNMAKKFKDIFHNNFKIEIQLIDLSAKVIADILRKVAKELDIQTIATGDCHYAEQKDAKDHQVLLCSSLKTTFKEIARIKTNGGKVPMSGFFNSDKYHIPSVQELLDSGNTEEEIENTNIIASECDDYDITGKPKLPKYNWTEGLSEAEFLRQLCRQGWKKKVDRNWDLNTYSERIKKELGVIEKANLPGYFLIVQDYVNEAKRRGWLIGAARGSGAGALTSYLLGITCIDPIPGDLIFERFYNDGRNTADRVALPDIDVDFPKFKRDEIIDYIKNRYGRDKVCQMVTFGRMQGRGAIKEVLRVHDACSHNEANIITKNIPHEAEIADQLELSGEESILKWVLENEPKLLNDYCRMEDDGTLSGDYAVYFEQAIRLEGTFKSQGKHAAGIVISADPLNEVCPMMVDKSTDELIAAIDMNDLEKMGHVKFDILGVTALDKLMGVNNLLKYGKIEHE